MTIATVVCFLLLSLTSQAESKSSVGQRKYMFSDSSRNRIISAFVWYPVGKNAKTIAVPDGPFVPSFVAQGATIDASKSKFPLVLVSHGSGGTAQKLFWLAEKLVQNGFVVLAVNHPGNMKGDNSADGMLRVWDRAIDFKFSLDQLLASAEFKDKVDIARIGAAGHSAGGTTVLLLGGARLSKEKFSSPTTKCSGTDDPYYKQICDQIDKIDFKKYSKETIERDYSDKRIKAVIALDPGFAKAFQASSFKMMGAHAHVFIADRLREPADEIYAKDFLNLMPEESEVVPSSLHMTFLSACRPDIPKNIQELKSLCANNEQKLTIQNDLSSKSVAFFNDILKSN